MTSIIYLPFVSNGLDAAQFEINKEIAQSGELVITTDRYLLCTSFFFLLYRLNQNLIDRIKIMIQISTYHDNIHTKIHPKQHNDYNRKASINTISIPIINI